MLHSSKLMVGPRVARKAFHVSHPGSRRTCIQWYRDLEENLEERVCLLPSKLRSWNPTVLCWNSQRRLTVVSEGLSSIEGSSMMGDGLPH